jgi:glutathione S-transferase
MKLYLLYRCPFGHRASMALKEKNLPFESAFFEHGKRPPELERAGRYAKSPTLIDGDTAVWDSQIVLEYIEDRYPEHPLMPSAAPLRAEVRMSAARVAKELEPKMGVLAVETLYRAQKDEAKIAEAAREFLAALEDWDRRLEGRSFLVGNVLTIADITLFTAFPSVLHLAGIQVPAERRHLRAWLDRMSARPASRRLEPSSEPSLEPSRA